MNCEQVKELLSPYLDDVLVAEERSAVATHLETCQECTAALTDFRRFDTLLSQMPRMSPSASLREKLFSSAEYLELIGATGATGPAIQRFEQTVPYKKIQPHAPLAAHTNGQHNGHVAAPETTPKLLSITAPTKTSTRRRGQLGMRIMQFTIAAAVLLTLGVGGLIAWNLQQRPATVASNTSSFTPPAGLQQGPIPAGIRFIFLRNGALWSAPTDGKSGILRLTPENVTVAEHWTVKSAQAGHAAGNMVAYVDLQQGFIHVIRSDGQSDTVIQQPLLKPGVQLATVWNTQTGTTILNSLSWSNDGSMLAFVADPQGTGQPGLYVYTPSSADLHAVTLPTPGGVVLHPTWSPDSLRIAFAVAQNNKIDVLDYNTHSHAILTLSSAINAQGSLGDTVLSLNWSPNAATPAVTWMVGQSRHIHSIWLQYLSTAGTAQPTLLASGDYAQALYSPTSHNNTGSWLLVATNGDKPGDITSVTLTAASQQLTEGKQVSVAQWSPDGKSVVYFETLSSHVGALHILNAGTGIDSMVAANAVAEPSPVWSANSRYLAYSSGTHVIIADTQVPASVHQLKQQGTAMVLSWSVASPSQLIVVTADGPQGLYLVNTQQDSALQMDKEMIRGPILWTQIP